MSETNGSFKRVRQETTAEYRLRLARMYAWQYGLDQGRKEGFRSGLVVGGLVVLLGAVIVWLI